MNRYILGSRRLDCRSDLPSPVTARPAVQISYAPGTSKYNMSDSSTREKLLAAAGPIFARRGFKAATVREICAAADVNVASVNYYFGDKKRLYLETVVAARQRRVDQYPVPEQDGCHSPVERLHAFILALLNRVVAMQTEPWEVRLLMRELMEPSEACGQLVEEYFRPGFEQLLQLVDELSPRLLESAERNRVGFSILGQILFYRFAADMTRLVLGNDSNSEEYNAASIARHICQFSVGAIRAAASQAGPAPTALETTQSVFELKTQA